MPMIRLGRGAAGRFTDSVRGSGGRSLFKASPFSTGLRSGLAHGDSKISGGPRSRAGTPHLIACPGHPAPRGDLRKRSERWLLERRWRKSTETPASRTSIPRSGGLATRCLGSSPRCHDLPARSLGSSPRSGGLPTRGLGSSPRCPGLPSRGFGKRTRCCDSPSRRFGKKTRCHGDRRVLERCRGHFGRQTSQNTKILTTLVGFGGLYSPRCARFQARTFSSHLKTVAKMPCFVRPKGKQGGPAADASAGGASAPPWARSRGIGDAGQAFLSRPTDHAAARRLLTSLASKRCTCWSR